MLGKALSTLISRQVAYAIDYAEPIIGSLSLDFIRRDHIVHILEPIWSEKAETVSRVRGRIEKILDWAAVVICNSIILFLNLSDVISNKNNGNEQPRGQKSRSKRTNKFNLNEGIQKWFQNRGKSSGIDAQ